MRPLVPCFDKNSGISGLFSSALHTTIFFQPEKGEFFKKGEFY